MGHKADRSFFDEKRPWSKRKDLILGYYLAPYLPKIATQKRPVLVVDGFAGPGSFRDGGEGSPLIICNVVKAARDRRPPVPMTVLCIEPDPGLHTDLVKALAPFPFAEARRVRFEESLPELESRFATHSVFLYLDPYANEGIEWTALERVFARLKAGVSVEILLNFNVPAFSRMGRASLKMGAATDDPDVAAAAPPSGHALAAERLDAFAGGAWWRAVLARNLSFPTEINALASLYGERVRARFGETAMQQIREAPGDHVPKYVLVFGSRHPHALELMNDAMFKSRELFAAETAGPGPLFESRPLDVVSDPRRLPALVRAAVDGPTLRQEAIWRVMRADIGAYSKPQIRGEIERQLKGGMLRSETGRARTNDKTIIAPGRTR